MQPTQEFMGLKMPVFTAFGWAGEEAALTYAFTQLELFIGLVHASLPASLQAELPVYGLSKEDQSVYLAADSDVESNVHIVFVARPSSLELQLALTNKDLLAKGLKQIGKDPVLFQRLLTRLGPDWFLHIRQVQIDEESGEQSHYQDLFKGPVTEFDEETAVEVMNKAAYLNSDEKWVTPIYISQRIPAMQASAMDTAIVDVMSERILLLKPLMLLLVGRSSGKRVAAKKPKKRKAKSPAKTTRKKAAPSQEITLNQFTYITELKPLHLRRGFINMTAEHWPFFAINARTETRSVIVLGDSLRDEESAVWRLQPHEIARLVLGPRGHTWLEDSFVAGEMIQLTATKIGDEIQIRLERAD